MNIKRRLPVGMQTFSKIREGGYVYVDKTDLVWKLINEGTKYNYLSRPRRFGKSILVDTLNCYFDARKELFVGLKIMDMETEWTARPVIRLDMSMAGESVADLKFYLHKAFRDYEESLGINVDSDASYQARLDDIIVRSHQKSGHRVAVLIDEYDYPLQHSWGTPEHDKCASVYRSVFTTLKADDAHIYFVFITGVTKFTQISLFSALNNLANISFNADVEAICGITQQELEADFVPEIEAMAGANNMTAEAAVKSLKEFYDGYHFSAKKTADVYNPFSLINALNDKSLRNYWIASGATSIIAKFVSDMEIRMADFDNYPIEAHILEATDVSCGNAGLFLFQTGYLTIKDFEQGIYILGFPNKEVRQALYNSVLPALAMRKVDEVQTSQAYLGLALKQGDIPKSMKYLKALIADVPYSNKKLASMDMEERYRLIISTILNAIGLNVEVEHMLSTGRIDMVATARDFVYVIELKLQKNGGLAAAVNQMKSNHYLAPFVGSGRQPIGLAIELDDRGMGLTAWQEVAED